MLPARDHGRQAAVLPLEHSVPRLAYRAQWFGSAVRTPRPTREVTGTPSDRRGAVVNGYAGLVGRGDYFCSANVSATFCARAAVLAYAMFDVTATAIPVSRRVTSDITLPPASSPLTLSAFVAR